MPCNRLTSLTGCNKCKFHVGDDKFLQTLRPEAIARVCLYLSQSSAMSTAYIDYETIQVSCSGNIKFRTTNINLESTYKVFRQNVLTCGRISDKWCKNHASELNTLVGCTMVNVRINIDTLSNVYAVREYLTMLIKYLRNITICDGVCETVTINKIISNCVFTLGEHKDVSKLEDPIVVLEALSQAMYAHKVTTVKRAFMDISLIQIKCDGTVILPSKYIYTSNPTDGLKKKCIDILTQWMSRHRYHRTSIYIESIIDACKKARDVRDVHMFLQRGIGCIEGFTFFD